MRITVPFASLMIFLITAGLRVLVAIVDSDVALEDFAGLNSSMVGLQ